MMWGLARGLARRYAGGPRAFAAAGGLVFLAEFR